MQRDDEQLNPAWPVEFEIEVLVYQDYWQLEGEQLVFAYDVARRGQIVRVVSVTPRPDDLVFIRGDYLDEEPGEATGPPTYYGIVSRWQWAARQATQADDTSAAQRSPPAGTSPDERST